MLLDICKFRVGCPTLGALSTDKANFWGRPGPRNATYIAKPLNSLQVTQTERSACQEKSYHMNFLDVDGFEIWEKRIIAKEFSNRAGTIDLESVKKNRIT